MIVYSIHEKRCEKEGLVARIWQTPQCVTLSEPSTAGSVFRSQILITSIRRRLRRGGGVSVDRLVVDVATQEEKEEETQEEKEEKGEKEENILKNHLQTADNGY